MIKRLVIIGTLLAVAPGLTFSVKAETSTPISATRIADIATHLAPHPDGPGEPISNREFWKKIGENPGYRSRIAVAKQLIGKPLPAQPDSLYLEFSENGNRTRWQAVANDRRHRLTPLVVAECIENNGHYLPSLETLINALCDERTWVMPAHDRKLDNFHGRTVNIDLGSGELGWQLAMTDHLLGEKLKPATRTRLKTELKRRIITPFQEMIHGKRKKDPWLTVTNNWNAVCLAEVSGCALIQVESPEERAEFIAAAEHYSKNFLSGFGDDGYCDEGLGYWNFGFGSFALMAENIRMATSDKVDLLANPDAARAARYGSHIEIVNGVSPAFADCSVNAKPDAPLMWLLNKKFSWGLKDYAELNAAASLRSLFHMMIYYDAQSRLPQKGKAKNASDGLPMRTLFPDGGVFIGRPDPGAPVELGVALKGGHNNESHNHNDIGSYVVVIGNTPILLDPGPEVYTARTFSSRRYESELLSSYGHPVPVIAGKLQSKGKKFRGKILHTSFTDTTDTIVLDMKSAYDVPALKRLVRTFTYVRGNNPGLIITDEVEFRQPETFETALISDGEFSIGNKAQVVVTQDKTSATISIKSSADYELSVDTIKEDSSVKPDRLAVQLTKPVTSATVTMNITER